MYSECIKNPFSGWSLNLPGNLSWCQLTFSLTTFLKFSVDGVKHKKYNTSALFIIPKCWTFCTCHVWKMASVIHLIIYFRCKHTRSTCYKLWKSESYFIKIYLYFIINIFFIVKYSRMYNCKTFPPAVQLSPTWWSTLIRAINSTNIIKLTRI